jgi:preprotein translocase subunit SecE
MQIQKPAITMNQNFVSDLIEELKKVTWPSRKETIRLTTIVIVISLIIGIYIGIIDILMAKGLEILTKFR